jgi:hypothetical protein
MPTKARDAEAVALASAMLRELAALRERGVGAYPPRLRQLAALAGESPTDDQVQQAAAKKSFTAAAVVAEKDGRKPALDGLVYFKEDAPKKPKPSKRKTGGTKDNIPELAQRMLLVLESQRRLGAEAYPPTLRRLAELCERNASDALVPRAAAHQILTDRAVVAAKASRGKANLDAPVILRDDLDGAMTAALPALLRFALTTVTSRVKGKTAESTAFTPTEVKGRVVPELQGPLLHALERGIERGELADGVAWVLTKGKPYFFLVENQRPLAARSSLPAEMPVSPAAVAHATPVAPAPPARDFAAAFREAFEHLDRRNRASNSVKLSDLRRALPGFGRDAFDAGLRALRLAGEFSLDSHEGLHSSLTPEEREAGVYEAGSLLVYVSRR